MGPPSCTLDDVLNQSSPDSSTEAGNDGKVSGRGGTADALSVVSSAMEPIPLDSPFPVTIELDDPPAKLADRPGRVVSGEDEAGSADRGEPVALEGEKDVCRNFGTSFPNSLEDLLACFTDGDGAWGLGQLSTLPWVETLSLRVFRFRNAVSTFSEPFSGATGFDGAGGAGVSWVGMEGAVDVGAGGGVAGCVSCVCCACCSLGAGVVLTTAAANVAEAVGVGADED